MIQCFLRSSLIAIFILIFSIIGGCSTSKKTTVTEDMETSCISGTVRYISREDLKPVPFPNVVINAWQHGNNQGLVDAKADREGNFCIDVPIGDYSVDLRVVGLVVMDKKNYRCSGSVENIDPGTSTNKCGLNCIKIDITTECSKFKPAKGLSR